MHENKQQEDCLDLHHSGVHFDSVRDSNNLRDGSLEICGIERPRTGKVLLSADGAPLPPAKGCSKASVVEARERLEKALGHNFKNPELFHRALTHRSAIDREEHSLEQLEIVGDAALHLVATNFVLQYTPGMHRSAIEYAVHPLVKNPYLTSIAWEIGVPDALAYQGCTPLEPDSKVYADAVEALIGAIYRDGGLAPVVRFLRPHLGFDDRYPVSAKDVHLGNHARQRHEGIYGSLVQQLYGRSLEEFTFQRSTLAPLKLGARPYRMSELEYVGHSVFRFAIRENYLHRHPDAQPGEIVRHRISLVERETVAGRLVTRVPDPKQREVIEKHRDGPERLMKGLLGAVYIDRGLEHAFDAVDYFFRGSSGIRRVPAEDTSLAGALDPREALKCALQNTRARACDITVSKRSDGTYRAQVRVGKLRRFARADGSTREEAEKLAAMRAVERIHSRDGVRGLK